jgi:hopanoid biosynthesis associated RND transporter like protein HpnN
MLAFIARLVEASRRHAALVATALILLSVLGGLYTARHASIDTDINKLISPDLPWRQQEAEMDREFPQNTDLLAIVIDAKTPDQASDAAATLTARLKAMPKLFQNVRQPDGGPFFQKNGLLFLPKQSVQDFADQIISAQPLLGTLAADPSLRGVFTALDLLAQGALHGDIDTSALAAPFDAVATATVAAFAGRYAPLSWQTLLSGRNAEPQELRRFVMAQAVLDYSALEPGARAVETVRETAKAAGLTPDRGVRVRITGSVALSDEQFASLTHGAVFSTVLSISLLCLWLLLALRSLRLFGAIVVTLVIGLIACATFAVGAVGPFNPISVAFAVLFVGISVDFSIQFSVRYREERHRGGGFAEALGRTALGIGGPLGVAALATAVGFYAFVPTDYVGVSDLGLIAGTGMLIALALNFSLLPAMLALLRPRGEPDPVGFVWAAPFDRFLLRRRMLVRVVAVLAAAAAAAALPWLHFDFNPLNLQNPHSEAVETLFDLTSNPMTTPYTIDILTPSPTAASTLARSIDELPEVARTLSVESFVPDNQTAKLAILADARTLLGPTLSPPITKPPPTDQDVMTAIRECADDVKALGSHGDAAAARLSKALDAVLARGTSVLPALRANLSDGIERRLDDLRSALEAQPVSLATLPPELKRDWVAADGKARVEVFPKGDARNNAVLRRFAAAVQAVAPQATGTPITIQESARTVIHAFVLAGIIAVVAISLLLLAVLRRVLDTALVLAPLLLAGLMTLATSVLLGLPINFANIITLPLLLGIGVAFDIYFVMRWRSGDAHLLQSSTARAVLFSALTTGTAFGSLALSSHPGTSDMGKLLSLALFFTLFCTFAVLPALLGPARREEIGGRE